MPGTRYDIDHLIPLSAGGPSTAQNLWPSHVRCNRSDGGRLGSDKTNGTTRRDKRGEPEW
ncbi:HNH endonuclease [Herbiconiux sp. VKM Ac-2851]|nr:HNH endonuclease [Herbiconiux sp. VKM Ac-2851]